jgi:hypothetical protein
MINIGSPKPAYTPPRPNVTASTLAPLSGAMGQLKSSLGYQQSTREGKERMEKNLEAGRNVLIGDVGRYEKKLEEMKKLVANANKGSGVDSSFLAGAKKNFETNVY